MLIKNLVDHQEISYYLGNYMGKKKKKWQETIIMIKKETPKRVTLPDGRTFVARYRGVTRAHLPANIRLRHPDR